MVPDDADDDTADATMRAAFLFYHGLDPLTPHSTVLTPTGLLLCHPNGTIIRDHEDYRLNCPYWYHENVRQLNPKQYPIWMFVIRVLEGAPPPLGKIIELRKYICEQINNTDNNKMTTSLDEQQR
jgi:hypothetical protein